MVSTVHACGGTREDRLRFEADHVESDGVVPGGGGPLPAGT